MMGYRAILCEILYEIKGLRNDIRELNKKIDASENPILSETDEEKKKRLDELKEILDEIGE